MARILLLFVTLLSFSGGGILEGRGSYYAHGVMDGVIKNRQRHGSLPAELPDVVGYIAILQCDRVGLVYEVRHGEEGPWEPFLVTDCAGIADGGAAWMVDGGWVAEFDFETLVRWEWHLGTVYLRRPATCLKDGSCL